MSYAEVIIKQCEELCESVAGEKETETRAIEYVKSYLCKLWKQPNIIKEWDY